MIMDRIFLTVLNMSVTASFVIAAVLLARLFLRRAPKIISYALWAVALFRLLFPFTIESVFSLMPFNAETIPPTLVAEHINSIDSGIDFVDVPVNDFIGQMHEEGRGPDMYGNQRTVYPLRGFVYFGAYLWLVGAAALLLYAVARYIRLKRRVSLAVRMEGIVYETDRIDSPFVLGLIRPRIYIPTGMDTALTAHIIEHERTHIKRRDYIVSVIAFAALALHWFNPLVWVTYMLMLRDMESSCDEAVLRNSNEDIRREYSSALLSFSRGRTQQLSFPLAFGEQSVKERVKNVLNFKKPSRVIIVVAVAVVAALSVGFAVNRVEKEPASSTMPEKTPLLDVSLISANSIEQRVRAAQLTNDWYVEDENGDGFGYAADSFHPLQKSDGYDEVTLFLYDGESEIKLSFSDNYPPQSISVQRWNAEYAGSDSVDVWDNGEPIQVNGTAFYITDDRQDYIYEVSAKWQEGDSWYVFRVNGASRRNITLADLRELAAKGDELLMENFAEYNGTDVGSGLYIMQFTVEGGYSLLVGNGAMTGKPSYAYFSVPGVGVEGSIDIRHNDIDEYIGKYPVPDNQSSPLR
jgi:beta-lactamase regulating signal transducer with metallopeptidase domain